VIHAAPRSLAEWMAAPQRHAIVLSRQDRAQAFAELPADSPAAAITAPSSPSF
jgi:hypothetical protein